MPKKDEITVVSRRPVTQARGRARREKLLQAAAELLAEKDLDEITFNDVAKHAGIPKGSAYHFYANVMDLYSALTAEIGAELYAYLSDDPEEGPIRNWEDVIVAMCRRAEDFYLDRPAARQLFLGGKTPPQYKRSDRENDKRIGLMLKSKLEKHFELPKIPKELDVFFHTMEIVDLMYCLSVIRHERITEEMGEEAIRAGVAYLRTYLPEILPKA